MYLKTRAQMPYKGRYSLLTGEQDWYLCLGGCRDGHVLLMRILLLWCLWLAGVKLACGLPLNPSLREKCCPTRGVG